MDISEILKLDAADPDSYKTTQNAYEYNITIDLVEGKSPDQFILETDPANSDFWGRFGDEKEIIAGKTWKPYSAVQVEQKEKQICLKVVKEVPGEWPVLFGAPGSHGLDRKATFLLGVLFESCQSYDNAVSCFKKSAEEGNYSAIMRCIDLFLGRQVFEGHDFVDLQEVVRLIRRIPKEIWTPYLRTALLDAYRGLGDYENMALLLEEDQSDAAKFDLAVLLSPILGKFDSPERAIRIFQELAEKDHAMSLYALALHYLMGVGVKKDVKLSKSLLQRAKSIDPAIQDIEYPAEEEGAVNKALVAGAVILGTGLSLLVLLRMLKKRSSR